MFKRRVQKKEVDRKVRSDKKREVKPNISISLKTEIERLAYILDAPIKDIGQHLCCEGVHDDEVITNLAPYFQRDVRNGSTIFFGSYDNPSLRMASDEGLKERISIRFPLDQIEGIDLLAHTLNVPVARAAAILLEESIINVNVLNAVIHLCNKRTMQDKEVNRELKTLMRYVNKDNPRKERTLVIPKKVEATEGYKITRNGRIKRKILTEDELVALREKLHASKRVFKDHPPLPTRNRNN